MLVDGGQNKVTLLPQEGSLFSYCQSQDYSQLSKHTRYIVYGLLMLFGLANSVMVLINLTS